MEGNQKKFSKFIKGVESQLYIPVYQRNYSWRISEVRRLMNDVFHSKSGDYFIGTIITTEENDYVIDGQQRLTTLMLMFQALTTMDSYKDLSREDKKYIESTIKTTVGDSDVPRIHFRNEKDRIPYEANLFNQEELISKFKKSNIISNYNQIISFLKEKNCTCEEMLNKLKKISIVHIELDDEKDDPQAIFEGINSTGKSLTLDENVKNLVLMCASNQEEAYLNYWKKIEDNISRIEGYNLNKFIKNCVEINKETTTISKLKDDSNDIYQAFRNMFFELKKNKNPECILEYLLNISEIIKNILTSNFENKELRKSFERLDTLGSAEVISIIPFLYHILEEKENNIIIEVNKYLFRYQFRRKLVGHSTEIGSITAATYKDLKNKNGDFFENFKIRLYSSDSDSSRFPTNEDIEKRLNDNMYKSPFRNVLPLLFDILENNGKKEKVDIYTQMNSSKSNVTIEHILPQTPTKWNLTGEEILKAKNYIHRIGNLVPSGLNSELSNNPFNEKKLLYKNSSFEITRGVCDYDEWNFKTIEDRSKEICKKICAIIPYEEEIKSQADFEKMNETKEIVLSNYGEIDPAGLNPTSISIYG